MWSCHRNQFRCFSAASPLLRVNPWVQSRLWHHRSSLELTLLSNSYARWYLFWLKREKIWIAAQIALVNPRVRQVNRLGKWQHSCLTCYWVLFVGWDGDRNLTAKFGNCLYVLFMTNDCLSNHYLFLFMTKIFTECCPSERGLVGPITLWANCFSPILDIAHWKKISKEKEMRTSQTFLLVLLSASTVISSSVEFSPQRYGYTVPSLFTFDTRFDFYRVWVCLAFLVVLQAVFKLNLLEGQDLRAFLMV